MQQDSELTLSQFLEKTKEHLDQYAGFVQHVCESLELIQHSKLQTKQRITSALKMDQNKKSVLIVDDAEINRVLMSYYFKGMPVDLVFANSGEQAVEKAAQQSFDLVLMDLQMKGMSGLEALKVIRSKNTAGKEIIIAISNLEPTEEEKSQVLAAGANVYLSKSMTREALREKVSEYVLGDSSSVA